MRNQLLRDADWAGMAHGIEIRVPLVDVVLFKALAPSISTLKPGVGKAALARAPVTPLPDAVIKRAKTGFGVPTARWMAAVSERGRRSDNKELVSRRWSRLVLNALRSPVTEAYAL
jgi:asparagine synthase (glutamine-hydrolysing)